MDDGDDGFCFWDYQPAVGTIGVPMKAKAEALAELETELVRRKL